MNSTPLVILAFVAGYLAGQYLGWQAAFDEMDALAPVSWEDIQREAAPNQ